MGENVDSTGSRRLLKGPFKCYGKPRRLALCNFTSGWLGSNFQKNKLHVLEPYEDDR